MVIRKFLTGFYFVFLALMFVSCFVPDLIEMGFYTDKMIHIFVVCFALLWPCITFERWQNIFLFALVIFVFGVSVEIIQGLIPDRNTEYMDIAANVTGIFVGLIIGALIRSGIRANSD